MSTDWLKGLNPEQAKAVQHNYGPLLILAGAGSGKTTVLVSRTGRMISDHIVEPQKICVLTFTNKAARELKHRVGLKVGKAASHIWAGTFHSFGLHLLRKYHKQAQLSKSFGVIDGSDCQALIKEIVKDMRVTGKDKFDTDKLLNMVNDLRAEKKQGAFYFKNKQHGARDEYDEVAEMIAPKFEKKLDLLGVVDFEGLLLKPLELFREHPEVLSEVQESIQQMMVDEFQDTNEVQMSLISQIVEPHKNVAVVGDDDQSIYGWRGACVSNILDFPKSYKGAEVIRLERNYRSTPAILDLANESIKQNTKRHGKVLRSGAAQDKGEKPELFILENEEAEAEFVVDQIRYFKEQGYSYKDIAVLYRSNSQGGLIESFLRRAHIDYSVSGGSSFFDRKEIKDVLSFLRCSVSPHEVALRRIINTPPRGIGDATIEKITEFCEKEKLNFVKTARNWRAVKIFEFSPKKESHQITLFHEEEAEFHESHGISVKAGESLDKLFKFFDHLPRLLFENPPVVPTTGFWSDRMLQVFNEKLNYRDYIYQTTHDPVSAEKKWQLFEIFSRVFEAFVNKGGPQEKTLCDFVDAMELRDESTEKEDHLDKVQLLTLHACKGLEFPVCIMVGLEEDVIPHKTLGSDIDEERRLFYVGLTRAEERLVLSRCKERRRHGSLKPSSPSRFIVEVCKSLYKEYPLGNRPVTESERESLVANFLASLDKKTPNSPPKRN